MGLEQGTFVSQGILVKYMQRDARGLPPVVFLHGWASSSRMWLGACSALEDVARCVAFDFPGHGGSDKPSADWYSIPRFSRVVADLCADLGLELPILVGHSMGGTVALEIAVGGWPPLLGLVAVNPLVTGRTSQLRLWMDHGLAAPLLAVSRRVWPVASRLLSQPPTLIERSWPDHVRRNRHDLALTTADSALGSMRAVLGHDLRERLPGIITPALVIVGVHDPVVAPQEGRLAAQLLGGAEIVELDAGHHPSDETPEAFVMALRAFITRVAVTRG